MTTTLPCRISHFRTTVGGELRVRIRSGWKPAPTPRRLATRPRVVTQPSVGSLIPAVSQREVAPDEEREALPGTDELTDCLPS